MRSPKAVEVGVLLEELTNRYVRPMADLARANIRSLERSLAQRRMVMIETDPPGEEWDDA